MPAPIYNRSGCNLIRDNLRIVCEIIHHNQMTTASSPLKPRTAVNSVQRKTLWQAISHHLFNLYMTKQQIAFELLVAGEIPASGESFSLLLGQWIIKCDKYALTLLLELINECSYSHSGKSHTDKFEGFCWMQERWRKNISTCVFWGLTQVNWVICKKTFPLFKP